MVPSRRETTLETPPPQANGQSFHKNGGLDGKDSALNRVNYVKDKVATSSLTQNLQPLRSSSSLSNQGDPRSTSRL